MPISILDEHLIFPPVEYADKEGLLAVGGDLSPERLILAYQSGIFPFFSEGEPILWWCPHPRFVLYPHNLKVSKTMKQLLNKKVFTVTENIAFEAVITNCSMAKRKNQSGTWILPEMIQSYIKLHQMGIAHSVEVWQNSELVGGFYGIKMGNVFFGESMFSSVSNASKAGFITFVIQEREKGLRLIDCQLHTQHLESLGAEMISREKFLEEIKSP